MNVRLCSTVSILCILFAQGRTTNHALESCLRELDADLLGMGGFNLGGTMDAAVGAGRSWWGEWSMQHQVQRPQACPPLGVAILSATKYHNDRPLGSPEMGTLINKCDYTLNRERFPVDDDPRHAPPLVLIIDPRTVTASLRTIRALRQVGGIQSSTLYVFLDTCGPSNAAWSKEVIERCQHGIKQLVHAKELEDIDFMPVVFRAIVLSDSMLLTLPLKATRWTARRWNEQASASPEYLKVRAMHAMRDVLTDGETPPAVFGPPRHALPPRHLSLVLLEAGCIPLPSFLRFHIASTMFLHRGAVIAVSSVAPPANHMQERSRAPDSFEHPCAPEHFLLSESLRSEGIEDPLNIGGVGGSIGLNRRGFLELYTTLALHRAMGMRQALQWLQLQSPQSRFFLHPSQHFHIELEIGPDGAEVEAGDGKESGEQACRLFQAVFDGTEEAPGEGIRGELRGQDVSVAECAAHGWAPRLQPRKVFDAVTYLQEHQMLLLRMHELNASVDAHIVVEGDLSFRGEPKRRLLHRQAALFEPFAHKLRVVEAQLPAHGDISCPVFSPDLSCTQEAGEAGGPFEQALNGSWTSGYRNWFKREWYSRHATAWGLWDAGPDDLVLMGDVDEIPRADIVRQLKWCDGVPLALGMTSRWYQYNASFQKPDWFLTPNAILFRALGHGQAGFARPDGASGVGAGAGRWINARRGWDGGDMAGGHISSKALRCYGFWHLIPWMEDVSWHLSYFGDTRSFLTKISSFSDEVELDVVTGERIDALVAQGIDLHSFLETLRDPKRTPGHGVRQLYRTLDYRVLPAYLHAHPHLFSFQFAADLVGQAGALGEESDEDGGWRECRRVRGGRLEADHSSLRVFSCKVRDEQGLEVAASAHFTRVQLQGTCDLPARPWPPLAPCVLPQDSAALEWTPPVDGAQDNVSPASQRPVVLIWRVLPTGAPQYDGGKVGSAGVAGEGQHQGDQLAGIRWKRQVEAFHASLVRRCSAECVSMQAEQGWDGDECLHDGYGDLTIYGFDEAKGQLTLPLDTAFKGQRELWGLVVPPQGPRPSHQLRSNSSLFELEISLETFPESFENSDGDSRPSVCAVCARVRQLVHQRCEREALVPGRGAADPHVLIMLPQNGHSYTAHSLRIVYRVAHLAFLQDGADVTLDIVGRQEHVLAVGKEHEEMRKVLSTSPRVEEFRFVIPYLEPGAWEVHVTLRDARRRPLAADHILFRTY